MDVWEGGGKRTGRFQNFCFIDIFPENFLQETLFCTFVCCLYIFLVCKNFNSSDKSCPRWSMVMESTSLTTSFEHLGPFDMQQNNGLKCSHDRKNYIDFQLDVLGGGGWGYFENVQWTLCVKESICLQPLSRL